MGFEVKVMTREEMVSALVERLPSISKTPERVYNAQYAEYMGMMNNRGDEKIHPIEIAELTVRGESQTDDLTKKLIAYVGGIHLHAKEPFLIICDDRFQSSGHLTMPARLSLKDLVGYRTIEELKK